MKKWRLFEVVWRSDERIEPKPYPENWPVDRWEAFLKQLYEGWGSRWANQ